MESAIDLNKTEIDKTAISKKQEPAKLNLVTGFAESGIGEKCNIGVSTKRNLAKHYKIRRKPFCRTFRISPNPFSPSLVSPNPLSPNRVSPTTVIQINSIIPVSPNTVSPVDIGLSDLPYYEFSSLALSSAIIVGPTFDTVVPSLGQPRFFVVGLT